MPLLLSVQALLDLSSFSDQNPVVRWAATLNLDHVYISVIAAGLAQAEINGLADSDPRKSALHSNLNALLDDFGHPSTQRLVPIDLAVVRRWTTLCGLNLTGRSADGTECPLDRASRLVVATALDRGYDLVEDEQPYHKTLKSYGLKTVIPTSPPKA
jgi:hypothetical protein